MFHQVTLGRALDSTIWEYAKDNDLANLSMVWGPSEGGPRKNRKFLNDSD